MAALAATVGLLLLAFAVLPAAIVLAATGIFRAIRFAWRTLNTQRN